MLIRIALLFSFFSHITWASLESYEKVHTFIEKHGREITLSLCRYNTSGKYSYEKPATYLEAQRDNARLLYEGFIGNFHPAKDHYLEKNDVGFLNWQTHVGSYFVQALILSQGFAQGAASCFQKLADRPEELEEQMKFFIDSIIVKDIAISLVPDVLVGGVLLKILKVASKFSKTSRALKTLQRKTTVKLPSIQSLSKTPNAKTLGVLMKASLIFPVAYMADGFAKENFNFDFKQFLKGQEQIPSLPTPTSLEDYQELIKWIVLWEKNVRAIKQIVNSDENHSPNLLKSLSYHLSLREILHSNVFESKMPIIESMFQVVLAENKMEEMKVLSSLLEDFNRWKESQKKNENDNGQVCDKNSSELSPVEHPFASITKHLNTINSILLKYALALYPL